MTFKLLLSFNYQSGQTKNATKSFVKFEVQQKVLNIQ